MDDGIKAFEQEIVRRVAERYPEKWEACSKAFAENDAQIISHGLGHSPVELSKSREIIANAFLGDEIRQVREEMLSSMREEVERRLFSDEGDSVSRDDVDDDDEGLRLFSEEDVAIDDHKLQCWFAETSRERVGSIYEHYIGIGYERAGFGVEYRGEFKGVRDGGIDLVAQNESGDVFLIQCKRWSSDKVVFRKSIHQFHGAVDAWMVENRPTIEMLNLRVRAVFYTTAQFDEEAVSDARKFLITLRHKECPSQFDCVRCFQDFLGRRRYLRPWDDGWKSEGFLHSGFFVLSCREAFNLGYKRKLDCRKNSVSDGEDNRDAGDGGASS